MNVGCAFTIETQETGIVQRWGKFKNLADAGFHWKLPFIDQLDTLDLRQQELKMEVATKTEDNVFVTLYFTILYKVMPKKIYEAYYMLDDETEQIVAYVSDSARAKVPKMSLTALFATDEQLVAQIKEQLDDKMEEFGYTIEGTLLTAIQPDEKVQRSLNEIQAATNERAAAAQRAEATRVTVVAQAKADAEAKELAGKGVAAQRTAIVEGLKANVEALGKNAHINPEEAMSLLLLTQYFDMLHALAATGPTTILLPHSPGGLSALADQVREALLSTVTTTKPKAAA